MLEAPPYDPALTLSRTLPSISSRPAGTAGYHLMFSMSACGKLSANCSFSFPGSSLSAPCEAVKLPAEAATLAAIVRAHVEVDPLVGGVVGAALGRDRERVDPAERARLRRDELDVRVLGVQLPAAGVPGHRGRRPRRPGWRSAARPCRPRRTSRSSCTRSSVAPTFSISAVYVLGIAIGRERIGPTRRRRRSAPDASRDS